MTELHTSVDSMVERVARALMPSLWSDDERQAHRAASPCSLLVARASSRAVARAAIAAMREPSEAMHQAALERWDERGELSCADSYRAMIDAALGERL